MRLESQTSGMSDGPPQDLTHWLIGAGGTMATAIAALWKRNESKNARAIRDLEKRIEKRDVWIDGQNEKLDKLSDHVRECDKDRENLRIEMARMEGRIGKMEPDHGT